MATRLSHALLLGAAALFAAPVAAQLLPSIGGGSGPVGGVVGGINRTVGDVARTVDQATANETRHEQGRLTGGAFDRVENLVSSIGASATSLLDLRQLRHSLLIDAHRGELDRDRDGNPVRRDRLIAIEPTPAQLAAAARAGFRVLSTETSAELGLRLVTLSLPVRARPRKAIDDLRRAAPGIDADYDHLFEPAGGSLAPASAMLLAGTANLPAPSMRIAMIDGGVAAHPSLTSASIEQRGFAGPAEATGHGTAVASLLVGSDGSFRGAARGSSLFVADVYGGNPAAGSASTIIQALSWAASKKPRLINISLVGPANRAIERAVSALRGRGIGVVAAVGNDGPAAPPQYPASYPGVVAITGVDGKGKALIEAGRSRHLDFAAPGADMAAALPGSGYAIVRGTSFAAPLAAARLAAAGSVERLAAEARPGKGKVGRGIVCGPCRIEPKAVGAR